KLLLLLIGTSELMPGGGIVRVACDRLRQLPLGVHPLSFVEMFEPLFVGLPRIFRRLRGGDAKRVSLHVREPAETDCSDVRIVQRSPEAKYDRIGLESGKIGADFASHEIAFTDTTLRTNFTRSDVRQQRIESTNGRVIKDSRISCAKLEAE